MADDIKTRCIGGKDEKDGAYKLKLGGKLILIVQLVISLVSMVMGILAYTKWSDNTTIILDLERNWNSVPFSDVRPLTSGILCPPGYEFWGPSGSKVYGPDSAQLFIKTWKGVRFCVRRDPEYKNAFDRIRADPTTNTCPTGYNRCGYRDCVKEGLECPVTRFTILDGVHTDIPQHIFEYQNYNFSILLARNGTRAPLVDMAINLQVSPAKSFCLGMTRGSIFREGCKERDFRYEPVDDYSTVFEIELAERYFLEENEAPPLALDTRTPYVDPILFTRSEVHWNTSCPVQHPEAATALNPLKDIANLQLVVLIFSVVGCAATMYLTRRIYNEQTDDKADNDTYSEKTQAYLGLLLDSVILVTTIIILSNSARIRTFLVDVADNVCTDPTTQIGFNFFRDEVQEANGPNIAILVLKGLWWLYRCLTHVLLPCLQNMKSVLTCAPSENTNDTNDDAYTSHGSGGKGDIAMESLNNNDEKKA